jgi:enolase
MKSVNAIIVKPNQVGSLIEISELIKLAKKYAIRTVMSHRSGETLDYSLADLAFGFQTDYIKTGIVGKEREVKLKRLIEIEKSI